MITPKTVKPSARDEAEAYEYATLRDLDCCVDYAIIPTDTALAYLHEKGVL